MSSALAGQPGRLARLRSLLRTGPLAIRDFRLFCIGQLTSTVGDFCYAVALPWLVLTTHGGTVLLGTVLACYGVPRTVLIPIGGALADRVSPRTVMLAADAVRCVLVAVLAVLAARGLASIAYLGPVAALIGAGEGIFLPASASIMPSLLPPGDLQAGNGLSSAAIQVGSLAGPVLGGILVTLAGGSATAFAVDAATFAVSAGALALMRARRDPSTVAATAPAAGTEAAGPARVWPLLRRSRELQTILLIAVLANFVIAGAFEVALPSLAYHRFSGGGYASPVGQQGAGAGGYGALIACFGIGSLAGTLVAARRTNPRRPAMGACAAFVLGAAAIALLPYLGGLPGAGAAAAIFGAAGYFGNVVTITLLQRWAPPELLGRVMSLVMLAAIGAFPASVALSGVIVSKIGPAPFFPAAGAVLAIAVLLAATQRQFRDFGARSSDHGEEGSGQAAVVAGR
ncbi:MAG TPA: MFS transporter [Streptosporangiaceae bacterium]